MRSGGTTLNAPEVRKAVEALEAAIGDPCGGLPEPVFLFASSITPLVNVDLLVRNERGQTLLTWRADGRWTPGWHVPGGIVRYKETLSARIRAVARGELGSDVEFRHPALAANEIIHPEWTVRAHFISFLFECRLTGEPDPARRYDGGEPAPGQWAWHDRCPENLIAVHEMYRRYMG